MSTTQPEVRRRRLSLIAAAAATVTAVVLAGCSGTPTEDGPVTLEFFNFTGNADHEDKMNAIIDAFEAENPDIKIESRNGAWETYFTELQTRIAGGTAPDTFELNLENFPAFAASGALLDLTSVGDAVDPDVFFPRAYEAFSYDGVQYGVPESFSAVVLYYNKRLFDEAGLEYPTNDWTWQDEKAAAEAIDALGDDIYGNYQPVQFNEFYKALAQSGGEFFNADKTEAVFNSPEGVEAASWLVDKVGSTMPTEAEMAGQGDDILFMAGRIGMWHTGIWMFGLLSENMEDEWDIVVEPGNTTKASHFFSNAAVASASTEHPEASAKWLQFLAASDETVEQRLNGNWEIPAVFSEAAVAQYIEMGLPDNRQAVFDALDAIVLPPTIERQQEMQDAVTLQLERAILGEVTVQEALDQAKAEVDALL